MIRSILAVLAGWLLSTVLVLGLTSLGVPFFTDVPSPFGNMEEASQTLGTGWLTFEFLISIVAGSLGGYLTAFVARRSELRHGMALAGLILVLGVSSVIFSAGLRPIWQDVAVTLLGAAAVLGGSFLRRQQNASRG